MHEMKGFALFLMLRIAVGSKFAKDSAASDGLTVQISEGKILGSLSPFDPHVRQFLGIPFASPPIRNLRWAPPVPHKGWSKIRNTSSMGFTCPQYVSQSDVALGYEVGERNEDCLTLNVWGNVECAWQNCSLPVLVWIYGGGWMVGGSALRVYDGTRLASQGTIVVSINYRVGIFGFLVNQELLDQNQSIVNFGVQDQQLALKWVRKNIAVFGGDPHRITLFGESAGSFAITLHTVLPSSLRLFRRAILISGSFFRAFPQAMPDMNFQMQTYNSILTSLGCATIACARKLTTEQLVIGQVSVKDFLARPVADGLVIPGPALTLLSDGAFAAPLDVAVIGMRDDGTVFVDMDMSDAEYLASLAEFAPYTARVLAKYPLDAFPPPRAGRAAAALFRDYIFVCPSRNALAAAYRAGGRAYQATFAHVSSWLPKSDNLGVIHESGNAYVFGASCYPFTPAEQALADSLQANIVAFAADGSMPAFPLWDPAAQRYLVLDTKSGTPDVAYGYRRSACDLLCSLS